MTHPSVGHSMEDPSDWQEENSHKHNSTYYPKQYIYPKQWNKTKIYNQVNELIIKFHTDEWTSKNGSPGVHLHCELWHWG